MMTAPEPAHYGSALRDTPYKRSAPIPIPNLRRVTDPPPRSPTRCHDFSSDLIFDMSPHTVNETPLTQQRDSLPVLIHTTNTLHYTRKPFNLSSRFAQAKSPTVERHPYWEEPFLYSVPRFPPPPVQHSRTQSARVLGSVSFADEDHSGRAPSSYPSSSSLQSLSHRVKPSVDNPEVSKVVQESVHVLTAAFQQSFSDTTSFTQSLQSPMSPPFQFKESQSPPPSLGDFNTPLLTGRPSHRRTLTRSSVISGIARTSAAEPVVSFAQAEIKHSPSTAMVTRVGKVARTTPTNSFRAKSPYPVLRGRRGSVLRDRSVKVSDEDLAGTFEKNYTSEKFGLEKFLLQPFPKGRGVDENAYLEDENIERGRTRSRVRGGRRT
jgi:hypothetical protein